MIKTLNREKLEPGAVSCRNWQSRKLGFREPELTRRVESLYLIVRAGDERERERERERGAQSLVAERGPTENKTLHGQDFCNNLDLIKFYT